MSLGGGIDLRVKSPIAIRLMQVDNFGLYYSSVKYWHKGFRLSAGIQLKFGRVD